MAPIATDLTGLQSLRAGGMSPRSKVLVIGASGGCGSAGVQLARALGTKEIVGVSSGKNAEMAQGADRVLDYTQQCLAEEAADFDLVYDTATASGAGEDYRTGGRALLAPPSLERRPQYVTINGGLSVWLRKLIGWQEQDTQLDPDRRQYAGSRAACADGGRHWSVCGCQEACAGDLQDVPVPSQRHRRWLCAAEEPPSCREGGL